MPTKMITAIGDVHGKVHQYLDIVKDLDTPSVQIGDFGFGPEYKTRDAAFEANGLSTDRHSFFGGNHDEYPVIDNHSHLGDFGTLPEHDTVFFVRGGYSIDKANRTPGYDWFPEEELSTVQSRNALAAYKEAEPSVMLSHDMPQDVSELFFNPSTGYTNYATSTGLLLQAMFDHHKPDKWIFGHWHKSMDEMVSGTRFVCLAELETFTFSVEEPR